MKHKEFCKSFGFKTLTITDNRITEMETVPTDDCDVETLGAWLSYVGIKSKIVPNADLRTLLKGVPTDVQMVIKDNAGEIKSSVLELAVPVCECGELWHYDIDYYPHFSDEWYSEYEISISEEEFDIAYGNYLENYLKEIDKRFQKFVIEKYNQYVKE